MSQPPFGNQDGAYYPSVVSKNLGQKELDEIHGRLASANGIALDEIVARWYRSDVPRLLRLIESLDETLLDAQGRGGE